MTRKVRKPKPKLVPFREPHPADHLPGESRADYCARRNAWGKEPVTANAGSAEGGSP